MEDSIEAFVRWYLDQLSGAISTETSQLNNATQSISTAMQNDAGESWHREPVGPKTDAPV
jgi:hypothetical protein